MWIVQLALKRPYTFIVLAILIAITGSLAALRTKDMPDRVVYYYERQLTAEVNNIEHIESQSLSGYGITTIYLLPVPTIIGNSLLLLPDCSDGTGGFGQLLISRHRSLPGHFSYLLLVETTVKPPSGAWSVKWHRRTSGSAAPGLLSARYHRPSAWDRS
jgi:hypothetical protein